MNSDVFAILVSLAERELDYADTKKHKVLEKALVWLQEMRDQEG
jgi:hypothetical protein